MRWKLRGAGERCEKGGGMMWDEEGRESRRGIKEGEESELTRILKILFQVHVQAKSTVSRNAIF